jgi:phosphotransferase system enzyme I (PtsI)
LTSIEAAMTTLSLKGQCASPGFACGVVSVLRQRAAGGQAATTIKTDPAGEAGALRVAITRAAAELTMLAAKAEGEAAEMLGFQIAMLEDDALSEPAWAAIADGAHAAAAWGEAMDAEIAGYDSSDDEYFRARASDLIDLRERVADVLAGAGSTTLPPGSIILADDITPSRFLGSDWHGGAILLRKGSATSHVAMLARARGVPMIVGLKANDLDGRRVLIDAQKALVLVDPSDDDATRFEQRRLAGDARELAAAAFLDRPAVTGDGTRIRTLINVADPSELDHLDPVICDGIGLVRTELLFEGKALPSEDAQTEIYARIVRWADGRPVTFRTLDAGGDKPIAGLTPDGESNPFLGVRGVRLTLSRPDVFLPQLKALARVASLGNVEIMIPMVSLPAEVEAARALLEQACSELAAEGRAHRLPALGVMVEVPATALTLDLFDAAFLSVGSNDLTQYVMAAGRDIAAVASLADPGHEAVLRMIGMVAAHGERTGVKVSLCGDAGGDERLIPLLLARGLRILSMSPRLLASAKQAIAAINLRELT